MLSLSQIIKSITERLKITPTNTGTGATGTWNINISGNAVKDSTGKIIADTYIPKAEIGVANGVAALDSSGTVPASQLPSYVDDVVEGYLSNNIFYRDVAHSNKITGEHDKIYIDITEGENKSYRFVSESSGYIRIDQAVSTADSAVHDSAGNVILNTYATKNEVAKKQNTLKFDAAPTANSTNPVTSAGIKTALDNKTNLNGNNATGTWPINIAGTAAAANTIAWNNIAGKPNTYTPATHDHDSSYPSITGTRATGTWGINITGNAAAASKLLTPRAISLTGNATGAANFDGSGDISINTTVNESKHAATATTVNATAPNGGAADLAFGTMAVNDYARIRVYGKDDNGALEIATADGGNEPIYARQYGGAYDWPNGRPGTVVNEAAILDGNGNTKFPKNVTAASFTGPLKGNADTASKLNTVGGGSTTFNWVGKNGQPTWLWGGNTAQEQYVYNPSNFHVAAANNDGNGANIANTYLKKAGDTATGKITFNSTDLNALPEVKKTSDDNMSGIRFSSKSKFLGAVGKRLSNGEDLLNLRSDNTTADIVLDSRNYNNYIPTKTGAGASGTWDINISGTATNANVAKTIGKDGGTGGGMNFHWNG